MGASGEGERRRDGAGARWCGGDCERRKREWPDGGAVASGLDFVEEPRLSCNSSARQNSTRRSDLHLGRDGARRSRACACSCRWLCESALRIIDARNRLFVRVGRKRSVPKYHALRFCASAAITSARYRSSSSSGALGAPAIGGGGEALAVWLGRVFWLVTNHDGGERGRARRDGAHLGAVPAGASRACACDARGLDSQR